MYRVAQIIDTETRLYRVAQRSETETCLYVQGGSNNWHRNPSVQGDPRSKATLIADIFKKLYVICEMFSADQK